MKKRKVILVDADSIYDISKAVLIKTENSIGVVKKSERFTSAEFRKSVADYLNKAADETESLKEMLAYKGAMKGNLGYKREEMPQLDAEHLAEFIAHFGKKKVSFKKVVRKLNQLKPAQSELNDDKVISTANAMEQGGIKNRVLVISRDNYLMDGHHFWAAALETDSDHEVTCFRINLKGKDLISRAKKMKLTRRKDLEDNIIKSELYFGFGANYDISKTWSYDLMAKFAPARWITYRGSHVLIKENKDGTGTIVAGNKNLEHLKVIPKTHEKYKELKKETEKNKDKYRTKDEFTEKEVEQSKQAVRQKRQAMKNIRKEYYQKFIDIAGLEDVSVEDIMESGKAKEKLEKKVAKATDKGEPTLKEVLSDIDESDAKQKKEAIAAIQDIATNHIVDNLAEEVTGRVNPDPIPLVVNTGSKELDKKIRKLKLTDDQAMEIQANKKELRARMKEVKDQFKDLIKRKKGNIEITSMQGIGIEDINSKPEDVNKLIEDAIKDVKDRQRAELNADFYKMLDERGDKVNKRLVEGAQNTMNAVAGKYMEGRSIPKELIDYVGVANAAKIMAKVLQDEGKKDKAYKDIEKFFVDNSQKVVKEAVGKLKDKHDRIADYEALGRDGTLEGRTMAINIARQYGSITRELGTAAGSLQAVATILDTMRDKDGAGDIVLDGGKNLFLLKKKLEKLGLSEVDTFIKKKGNGYRVTIPNDEFSKLLTKTSEANKRDKFVKDLKAGKLDRNDWRPDGVSSTFYDWKTPKQFKGMSKEKKAGWETYNNKKGEPGYTSQFPEGEQLYRKKIDGFALKDSQYRMVQFGLNQKRAVWNAGAGLGKTISFLSMAQQLKQDGKVNYSLITVPSRLVDEFSKDQEKFFPDMKVLNLDKVKGMENKEKELAKAHAGEYDMVLTGHDSVKKGFGGTGGSKPLEKWAINKVQEEAQARKESGKGIMGVNERKELLKKYKKEAKFNVGVPGLINKYRPGYVGVDEAHEVFKNVLHKTTSQKFEALKVLAKGTEYFTPATGTAIRNSVGELANLVAITNPDEVSSPTRFANKWENIGLGTNLMQREATDSFRREFDNVMITERTKVTSKDKAKPDPKMKENRVKVELTDRQNKEYKKNEALYRQDRDLGKQGAVGLVNKKTGEFILDNKGVIRHTSEFKGDPKDKKGNMTSQAKQFLKSKGYDPSKMEMVKLGLGAAARRDERHNKTLNSGDWKTNAKMQAAIGNYDKILSQDPTKKQAFYFRRNHTGDTLKQAFKDKGYKPNEVAVIDGSTSYGERKKQITKFQTDPNVKVILLSEAGMTGINLQSGTEGHWIDRPTTFALQDQGMRRLYRTGQENDVNQHFYDSSTPYDNNKVDNLERKRKQMEAVGDVGKYDK